MSGRGDSKGHPRRGSEIVEFALASFLVFVLIMGVFEISRMVLVYSSIANAAREGVRYAASNGSDKNSPASASDICNVVKSYTSGLNNAAFSCGTAIGTRINVAWPDGSTAPGSRVKVSVVYKYDPFFSYLPLAVNLGSTSEGYIMY